MNRLSYPRNATDENENETQIIVKFTHWHCIEFHAFCSESGCVPKIPGYQEFSWGMDRRCQLSASPISVTEDWDEHQSAAVARWPMTSFHSRGQSMEHGDSRRSCAMERN